MKKKILLIRHSRPDFPGGIKICMGSRTDIGICDEGREKARELRRYLEKDIADAGAVHTSPLKRARETAEILAGDMVPVITDAGLTEMDAGEWDGLDFETIRTRYPEIVERRGDDMSICPVGGEEFPDGSQRMRGTLEKIAEASESDTVIAVAHAGINRAFLSDVTGIEYKYNMGIPQDYTSVNTLIYYTVNRKFVCLEAGYEGYVQ